MIIPMMLVQTISDVPKKGATSLEADISMAITLIPVTKTVTRRNQPAPRAFPTHSCPGPPSGRSPQQSIPVPPSGRSPPAAPVAFSPVSAVISSSPFQQGSGRCCTNTIPGTTRSSERYRGDGRADDRPVGPGRPLRLQQCGRVYHGPMDVSPPGSTA